MITVEQTKDKNYPFLLEDAWGGKLHATEDDLLALFRTLEKHFDDKEKAKMPLTENCESIIQVMRDTYGWVTVDFIAERLGKNKRLINGCLTNLKNKNIVEYTVIDNKRCYRIRPDLLDYL
jgi:hypothetical protein